MADTEIDVKRLERDPAAFEKETAGWFEASYFWSIVTMAVHTRATASARRHQEMLFYCQAVGASTQIPPWHRDTTIYDRALAVPSRAATSRLPGVVLFHLDMRVRLTTQVLPP